MNVRVYGPDISEFHTVKTAALGTSWVALPDVKGRAVTIFNTTGTDLLVKYSYQPATAGEDLGRMTLPAASSRTFSGLKVPNEARSAKALSIKRKDDINTQVDVEFEVESL
jgi:hypothetical protein